MTERPLTRRASLGHVPAYLGLGALAIYIVGVIRTAGRLEAVNVSPAEGFLVLPLERHFMAGLGALIDRRTLGVIVLAAVTAALILLSDRLVLSRAPSTPVSDRLAGVALAMTWLVSLVLAPWYTTPFIALLALTLAVVTIASRRLRADRPLSFGVRYLVSGVVAVVALAAAQAYFAATPPAEIVATLSDNGELEGSLIGTESGAMFIATKAASEYEIVPYAQVERVVVSEARPRSDAPSLLEVIGIL